MERMGIARGDGGAGKWTAEPVDSLAPMARQDQRAPWRKPTRETLRSALTSQVPDL